MRRRREPPGAAGAGAQPEMPSPPPPSWPARVVLPSPRPAPPSPSTAARVSAARRGQAQEQGRERQDQHVRGEVQGGQGRGGGGGRERGARAGQPEQVQEAEEGPRKGAEGRGQVAEGVGAGLRPRICAHRLLAGAPSPPPEPPPSVVREAHLVHARRVAPRRDACTAAHRQPPARARPSSLPRAARSQPAGCQRAGSLWRARTQHSTPPSLSTRSSRAATSWR